MSKSIFLLLVTRPSNKVKHPKPILNIHTLIADTLHAETCTNPLSDICINETVSKSFNSSQPNHFSLLEDNVFTKKKTGQEISNFQHKPESGMTQLKAANEYSANTIYQDLLPSNAQTINHRNIDDVKTTATQTMERQSRLRNEVTLKNNEKENYYAKRMAQVSDWVDMSVFDESSSDHSVSPLTKVREPTKKKTNIKIFKGYTLETIRGKVEVPPTKQLKLTEMKSIQIVGKSKNMFERFKYVEREDESK